jgi:cysteine desulfurase
MRKVYMDNAAATRPDPRVVEALSPYIADHYGNPASLHGWGEEAKEAVDRARAQVASLIGARPAEIIFTADGSEANNLAIKGIGAARAKKGKHLVVSAIEHFSVLQAAKRLEAAGWELTVLPVDRQGLVDPESVIAALRDDTALVSIMHANGEVGTVQPLAEIAALLKKREIAFHTDAVATAGTIPVNVDDLGVDALSLASNQFYGPKGAAALYLRRGTRIQPLIDGGVQEEGRRAGTENVAGIVGMGAAAELAVAEMTDRAAKLTRLRDRLIGGLLSRIDGCVLNGHSGRRLPGNAHIRIDFIEGESMLIMLNMAGIAAASGSACTSRTLKASHVLKAMGVPHEQIHGSLLFSLGKENDDRDVDYVIETLPPIVARLRAMSPLTVDAG